MFRQQGGFILLIVLLFMQVFSLLGLYSLMHATDMLKLVRETAEHDKHWRIARHVLATLTGWEACMIPVTPAAMLGRKNLAWWKEHGCAGEVESGNYYYVAEFLAPNHYRVTLVFSANRLKFHRIVLQEMYQIELRDLHVVREL